jgi:hypothetical protein
MNGTRRNPLLIGAITAGALVCLYLAVFVLTNAESLVGLWLLVLAALVTVIVRRRRGAAASIWAFAFLLVIVATMTVQDFVLRQRWPVSRLSTFWTVKHWILLGGLGCLAMSVVTYLRSAATAHRTEANRR